MNPMHFGNVTPCSNAALCFRASGTPAKEGKGKKPTPQKAKEAPAAPSTASQSDDAELFGAANIQVCSHSVLDDTMRLNNTIAAGIRRHLLTSLD